MNERAAFQHRRLALLSPHVDLRSATGLEIGASDLPTVPESAGACRYADFRTADEMAQMWNLPRSSLCSVDYLLNRTDDIGAQVPDRFDYVIACHVLEHVPDVITYINSLRSLLIPGAGKVIFLTLPDKRATLDRTRPSTTVDRLLGYYHSRLKYPLFDHVLEFHRHWVGYGNGAAPLPLREAYDYADRYLESGEADAHCHVWEDQQFVGQVQELIDAGFIEDVEIAHFEPFVLGTNEFAVVLRTIATR